MFKDDDDDEENTFNVTRYACMPSLVALQQMRNRLHLAHLGRKLMKWTALATGRELRKIAMELDAVVAGFAEEMRDAFILLARARYFCPELNSIVLENIGHNAAVMVIPTMKTVSAVKTVQFDILETGVPPYEHLGIQKGGQAIMEAKLVWLDLLKKLILMMQLRSSFIMVEQANKTATKRLNVLKKIVIPRYNVTSEYILSELEELAREEFFRLKKIKDKKKKRSEQKHDHQTDHVCPICDKRMDGKTKDVTVDEAPTYKQAKPAMPETRVDIARPTVSIPPRIDRAVTGPSTTQPMTGDRRESRLEFLKRRLSNIIEISKNFVGTGIDKFDVNEFLAICEAAKIKIEEFFETEPSQDLEHQMQDLKCNLREVVDVTKQFKQVGFTSSSIDKFLTTCEKVDSQLNEREPVTTKPEIKVEEIKTHIEDVMEMTNNYTAIGLLTPDVDEFLNSCMQIKAKIEGTSVQNLDTDEAKLDHLKTHIDEMEALLETIKEKKITSESVEKFVSLCKDFKMKIDEDKEKLQTSKTLHEISGKIDNTLSVAQEAQKEGLLGESVEDFIKSIGDVKQKISKGQPGAESKLPDSDVLEALKSNIDTIIKSASKLKSGNLASMCVDEFIQSCEEAKTKIDIYKKYCPTELEKAKIYPTCGDECVCETHSQECEKCKEMADYYPPMDFPAPCDSCVDNEKEKQTTDSCHTCSRPIEADILLPEPSPAITPEESQLCEVCERLRALEEKEKENEKEEEEVVPPTVDSSLGYFEKKVRKITRVKRSQNPDGTIREETETITVRKEKHDPTETELPDDENEEYDVSYDSLSDDDGKKVAICTMPKGNQRGFVYNKAKSETICRVSPMTLPILKQCISYDGFIVDSKSEDESVSIEIDFCSLNCNSNIIHQSQSLINVS